VNVSWEVVFVNLVLLVKTVVRNFHATVQVMVFVMVVRVFVILVLKVQTVPQKNFALAKHLLHHKDVVIMVSVTMGLAFVLMDMLVTAAHLT
jgi:hypothetical protein